jgi:hypothetical protein
MKVAIPLACILMILTAAALATAAPIAEKPAFVPSEPSSDGREGGETIETAFAIAALPFYDTGDTSDNVDDYDESCPYVGSTSPDVVYAYTPPSNQEITISLCDSGYDTKTYVYDVTGALLACNDDFAGCGPSGWRSKIECLPIQDGVEIYIVIDGYGGNLGFYDLDITSCASPVEEATWGMIKVLYR